MTNPRFTSSERDRDVLEALRTKVTGHLVTVERYTARGSNAARIPLNAPRRPAAVMLAHAEEVGDPSAPPLVAGTPNFIWDSGSRTAQVFEPAGLTGDTVYRLIFLVLEA